MTTATSPYLNRPLRSLADVKAKANRVQQIVENINREHWAAMDAPARDAWKRINEGFATHPVLGRRHICQHCGWDWYDHGHEPDACPDCGAGQQRSRGLG